MKKITKKVLLSALLVLPLAVTGQMVLTMPSSPLQGQQPQDAATQKVHATTAQVSSLMTSARQSMLSADDQAAYQQLLDDGLQPVRQQSPWRDPNAPEDSTIYTYTGYNSGAGVDDEGNSTWGMVNFNLQPFACDTVSSDFGLSPYSYVQDNKLYCFLPIGTSSTKGYLYYQVMRSIYDANTLELLDQKTFDCNPTGDQSRVPYLMTYDTKRDVVWVISMGNYTQQGNTGNTYYLNMLDTATCTLKRMGVLGDYDTNRAKGNFSPKGFTNNGSGTLLTLYNDNGKSYVAKVDPATVSVTTVGSTSMPSRFTYGLQPMIYKSGNLLVNHYDMVNGTQFYQVGTYVPNRSEEDTVKTVLLESTPTGYQFFYQRPATVTSYYTTKLANPDDLEITVGDDGTAHISMTIPAVDVNGDSIQITGNATDAAGVQVYVDNKFTAVTGIPTYPQPTLGEHVEGTFTVTQGLHVVTVIISPNYYTYAAPSYTGRTIFYGYDAPDAVTNAKLSIRGKNATISWTAPTQGRYADFGSNFDATDITYKVVRNFDGKVICEDTTATKIVDQPLGDEYHTYSYTIYAISHEQQGTGVQTNSIIHGSYMPLPYEENFEESSCLDTYTIINVDQNGEYRTWRWNNIYYNVATHYGVGDDWLITPLFKFEADSLYMLKHLLRGQGELIVTMGTGNTVDEQTTELETIDRSMGYVYTGGFNTNVYEWKEYFVVPTEDGLYDFGFHDYNINDQDSWVIDSLQVRAIAPTTAPGPVRNLVFTPEPKGALGGTFTFNLPSVDIKGNTLSSLTKVTIYDMYDNELVSSTSVTPGAEVSLSVAAIHGWNQYVIVAANEHGNGYPVTISKFVGPDVPKPVTNLKAVWGEEWNIANISWDATTEGINGGYVDVENLNYKLYKYTTGSSTPYTELATTPDDEVELQIADASQTQTQYVFAVTAFNDEGESDYTTSAIVLGKPYNLPFVEPFSNAGLYHTPYVACTGINGQNWTMEQGIFNLNIQPQNADSLQLMLRNTGSADGSGAIESPIIDFSGAEHPTLSVWLHHSDGMPEEAFATVIASLDGSFNFITLGDTARLTGNSGWVEHLFDLSKLNGKQAQIALYGYLPTPSQRMFADNWNIGELSGKDMALTAISQPYCPVVGDNVTIEVSVTNRGAEVASNYSVMFNVNGETVGSEDATAALAPGATAIYQFPLSINAGMDEIIYYAEVEYDGDENLDNNISTEVELTPEQLELPAPKDLTINENKQLNWVEPDKMDGREVTLTFEDVPAFTTDNINGWTTYDGDGRLATAFIQYYGNYWPYAFQPLAWMTWSAAEAGTTAEMWKAYEGDKCLIHWGNYDIDAEGRNVTEEINDDWFISPEVKGGTSFSFMTLSNNVGSSIEVLVSTTDRNPSSFTTCVATVTYAATATWYEIKATLPQDAKYVAIHTVVDEFGLMVDNIKYTEARTPELLYYNIYHNSNIDATATQTAYDASGEAHHTDKYGVSAVYDLGESELTNLVTVSVQEVYDPSTNVRVIGGNEQITVLGADGRKVSVFTVAGQQVATTGKAAGTQTYRVNSGIYVVNVEGKAFKVLVK